MISTLLVKAFPHLCSRGDKKEVSSEDQLLLLTECATLIQMKKQYHEEEMKESLSQLRENDGSNTVMKKILECLKKLRTIYMLLL